MSDLTDINIATTSLNSTLFPGAPSDITVHKGFSDEHGLTGGQILAEVNKQLTVNNAKQVTLVSGHCVDRIEHQCADYGMNRLVTHLVVPSQNWTLS
jgi:hypothetical protein